PGERERAAGLTELTVELGAGGDALLSVERRRPDARGAGASDNRLPEVLEVRVLRLDGEQLDLGAVTEEQFELLGSPIPVRLVFEAERVPRSPNGREQLHPVAVPRAEGDRPGDAPHLADASLRIAHEREDELCERRVERAVGPRQVLRAGRADVHAREAGVQRIDERL